jgi:carboxymethylenebutenolidase
MRISSLELNTTQGATTAYVDRPEHDTNTAVILIHEWWGINQHIRDLASRYAGEGYNCVAPDLFRGRVAQDTAEASALMQALAVEDGIETIRKAMDAHVTLTVLTNSSSMVFAWAARSRCVRRAKFRS